MYSETALSAIGSSSVVTSVADIMTFTPTFAVEIYEFGIIMTAAATASDAFTIALDKRPTAGTDTGRTVGAGDFGTLAITSANSGGVVAGDVIVSRPAAGPYIVYPGQQAIMNVTATCASGTGLPFINYRLLPAQDRSSGTITNVVTA